MNELTDIFYYNTDGITNSNGSKMPPSDWCLPLYSHKPRHSHFHGFKLGCSQKTLSTLKHWPTEQEKLNRSELWEKGGIQRIKLGTHAWEPCTLPTEQEATLHSNKGLSDVYALAKTFEAMHVNEFFLKNHILKLEILKHTICFLSRKPRPMAGKNENIYFVTCVLR